jgi:hypothetical protein
MVKQIQRSGLDVQVFEPYYDDPDKLVHDICESCDCCCMDYSLQDMNFANFNGAVPLARLYDQGIAGVLVTAYMMDHDVGMRIHRAKIPALIKKSEKERFLDALALCYWELQGKRTDERKLERTFLTIGRIKSEDGVRVADVFMRSWSEDDAVRVPLEKFPLEKGEPVAGMRFTARVNLGAREEKDLFFEDIEFAPEPIGEDWFG